MSDSTVPRQRGPAPRPAIERFWEKVDKRGPDECWEWQGTLYKGYGSFHMERGFATTAQRASHLLLKGPIPEGYEVDHLCKNPACVNPAHLEAVPPVVNLMRSDAPCAQNARKTHCKRGHEFTDANTYIEPPNGTRRCLICRRARDVKRRPSGRMTPGAVLGVLTAEGTYAAIAERYGTTKGQVNNIKNGWVWNELTGLPRRKETEANDD